LRLFRLYQKLPSSWRRIIELIPFHFFSRQYARALERTFQAGPPYRPSHRSITIDITEDCDLGCVDCSRSCGNDQAPSKSYMKLEQIEQFISESKRQGRKWELILIEGGEPTLHPLFLDIVCALADYLKHESPGTILQVNTNGYSESSQRILSRIPPIVIVCSSAKKRRIQDTHLLINIAPADLSLASGFDLSQGCYLPAFYGLGLNRYGYYPHPICGSIDRVFGFDIGRKNLPEPDDDLGEQFPRLCCYCGMFLFFNRLAAAGNPLKQLTCNESGTSRILPGTKTESWQRAYREYAKKMPVLKGY
jgi:hypothetical protein